MSYAGVSIYHANDGGEWANYLLAKLNSTDYAIHCLLNNINNITSSHTRSKNVNIFLISPDFLDRKDWQFMQDFEPSSTLAILTGITRSDLTREARRKNCQEVLKWIIHELTQSEDAEERTKSVRDMMVTVVAAYEGALREEGTSPKPLPLRRAATSVDRTTKLKTPAASDPAYDILPPKRQVNAMHFYSIKGDKLFVILHREADARLRVQHEEGRSIKPDQSDTSFVYVFPVPEEDKGKPFSIFLGAEVVGKCERTSTDLNHFSNTTEPGTRMPEESTDNNNGLVSGRQTKELSQTIKPKSVDVGVQTDTCGMETEPYANTTAPNNIEIILEKPTENDNTLVQARTSHELPPTPHKPTTVKQTTRDIETELLHANVTTRPKNIERQYSSQLDQLYDLLKDITDPVGSLCSCLGIENDTKALDEKLKSFVDLNEALRNIPTQAHPDVIDDTSYSSSPCPTLLHLGARLNLQQFCETLLMNPLMHASCLVKNCDGLSPHDLAKKHGHTELSVLLRHFTKFVTDERRTGKYDSGVSCDTPRLSTITLPRDSQGDAPPPHCHMSRGGHSGYTNMNTDMEWPGSVPEEGEFPIAERRTTPPTPPPRASNTRVSSTRTISTDVGFEEEDFYPEDDPIPEEARNSSATSISSSEGQGDPFANIIDYSPEISHVHDNRLSQESVASGVSNLSLSHVEDDFHSDHHRKDINAYLGTDSSPSEKSKSFLRAIFAKKRSKSEPNFQKTPKSKTYRRESNRSSSTSTSSGSSGTFADLKIHDETQVQLRDSDTHHSKNIFNMFISKAKRRKSVRIKNVMIDPHMSGPKLPPRRHDSDEQF